MGAADDLGSALEKTIQQEIAVLRSCAPGSCPVFFVHALGRRLAIPNRFAPRMDDDGVTRRYISPDSAVANAKGIAAGEVILGSMFFGRLEGLQRIEREGHIKLRRLGSAHGAEIYAVSLAGDPDDEFARALIAADEYVQISDQNPQLPELMLELGSRLAR